MALDDGCEISHDGYIIHKVLSSPLSSMIYASIMGNDKGKHGFIDTAGCETFWEDGVLHRVEGPAVRFMSGYELWVFEGDFHRLDGYAVVDPNGVSEYWINGEEVLEEDIITYVKPAKRA